jgi:KRAB domain-containing zinc finger protein
MLDKYAWRKKLVKKGDRSAVCPCCQRDSMTEFGLRQHLQKEHNYLPCKACRQIFPDAAAVRDHNCPLQNIPCDQCPKRFNSLDGWVSHRRTVHRGMQYICYVCGRVLAYQSTLTKHMEVAHGILPPLVGTKGKAGPGKPRVAPSSYFCHKCGKQVPV